MVTLFTLGIICLAAVILIPVILFLVGLPFLLLMGLLPWLLRFAGVVLLVKAEMADEVAVRVEDAGVFVVPKPLNRALLFGAVKLAQAANRRIMGLQRQNNILQQKIDDIRLVDRAKCALIQYRLLTEPEAHKYIEREAMDSRRTRREVAQAILRMYEGGC